VNHFLGEKFSVVNLATLRGDSRSFERSFRALLCLGFLALLMILSVPQFAIGQEGLSKVPEPEGPMTSVEQDPQFDAGSMHRYSEPAPLPRRVKRSSPKSFSGYLRQRKYFTHLCNQLYEDGRADVVREIGREYRAGIVGCAACKAFFRLLFSECRKPPRGYQKIERKITALQREKRREERLNKVEIKDNTALLDDLPSLEIGEAAKSATIKKAETQEKTSSKEGSSEDEETLEDLLKKLPRKQLEPRLFVIESASRFAQAIARDSKRLDQHLIAIQQFEKGLLSGEGRTEGEKLYLETLSAYIKSPFVDYEREFRKRELRERLMSDQERRNVMMREAVEETGQLQKEAQATSEDLFYDPDNDLISFD